MTTNSFSSILERWLLGALVVVLVLAPAGTGHARAGSLAQLLGLDACVSENGGACADGTGLSDATGVAVSRDGRHVYVASSASNAVAVFARNKKTGGLAQLSDTAGCVSEDGSGGCTDGTALLGVQGIVGSKDGKHVYVASINSAAVAAFGRDRKTGRLSQLQGLAACVSLTGTGGACIDGTALGGSVAVAMSPDGKYVYVAAVTSDAVAVLARDKKTGALSQLAAPAGCVSDSGTGGLCTDGAGLDGPRAVAVSPDGKHLYVAAALSNAVVVFVRDKKTGVLTQLSGTAGCVSEDGTGGACADGTGLMNPQSLAVSPDGKYVYVTSVNSSAVVVLARDKKTGALRQLPGIDGCVSEDGSSGACADGMALQGARAVAVSTDGKSLYVASLFGSAIAVLERDKKTGTLTQPPEPTGCVSLGGSGGACLDGTGIGGAAGVAVSKDGKHVYVAALNSDAVAVFVRARK